MKELDEALMDRTTATQNRKRSVLYIHNYNSNDRFSSKGIVHEEMAQDSSALDASHANQNKRKAKQQLKDLTRNQKLLDSSERNKESCEPKGFK